MSNASKGKPQANEWEKEFDERFVRDDGLLNKYYCDKNDEQYFMAEAIKLFFHSLLQEQREQVVRSIKQWSGEWLKRNQDQVDIGTAVGYDAGLRSYLKKL